MLFGLSGGETHKGMAKIELKQKVEMEKKNMASSKNR
jgi:hypothetical protein